MKTFKQLMKESGQTLGGVAQGAINTATYIPETAFRLGGKLGDAMGADPRASNAIADGFANVRTTVNKYADPYTDNKFGGYGQNIGAFLPIGGPAAARIPWAIAKKRLPLLFAKRKAVTKPVKLPKPKSRIKKVPKKPEFNHTIEDVLGKNSGVFNESMKREYELKRAGLI